MHLAHYKCLHGQVQSQRVDIRPGQTTQPWPLQTPALVCAHDRGNRLIFGGSRRNANDVRYPPVSQLNFCLLDRNNARAPPPLNRPASALDPLSRWTHLDRLLSDCSGLSLRSTPPHRSQLPPVIRFCTATVPFKSSKHRAEQDIYPSIRPHTTASTVGSAGQKARGTALYVLAAGCVTTATERQ